MKYSPEALLDLLVENLNENRWMLFGLCATDPPSRAEKRTKDILFLERGDKLFDGYSVCFDCPVRKQCEEYKSIHTPGYGIWGGRLQRKQKNRARDTWKES